MELLFLERKSSKKNFNAPPRPFCSKALCLVTDIFFERGTELFQHIVDPGAHPLQEELGGQTGEGTGDDAGDEEDG